MSTKAMDAGIEVKVQPFDGTYGCLSLSVPTEVSPEMKVTLALVAGSKHLCSGCG